MQRIVGATRSPIMGEIMHRPALIRVVLQDNASFNAQTGGNVRTSDPLNHRVVDPTMDFRFLIDYDYSGQIRYKIFAIQRHLGVHCMF